MNRIQKSTFPKARKLKNLSNTLDHIKWRTKKSRRVPLECSIIIIVLINPTLCYSISRTETLHIISYLTKEQGNEDESNEMAQMNRRNV